MPEAPVPIHQLTSRRSTPLIGVPIGEGDEATVRYFTDEEEADRALSLGEDSIARALGLAGAWQALDAGKPDPLDELDRIRHASKPTPPFEL